MKTYTERQLEVINVNSGYNMVLAGPGCGKTDILAERVTRAYDKGDADLTDMLCLTFTNRAARGMYNRILQKLPEAANELFVGNIHKFCSHFLFDQNIVSAEASILDEDDTADVLRSIISDEEICSILGYYSTTNYYGTTLVDFDWIVVNKILNINRRPTGSSGMVTPATANNIINEARHKILDIQHLMTQIRNEHPKEDLYHQELIKNEYVEREYPSFQNLKEAIFDIRYDEKKFYSLSVVNKIFALGDKIERYKESNCLLDFDDLLIKTYDAYYSDFNHTYPRFKWIQIDEIQDLSNFQISLVDLFTDKSSNFVVLYLGDEQQAIYSFMGASLRTLDMIKQRCLNNIYRLDKNFRSPKYLLDLYNEYAIKELNVDKDFLPEPKDDEQANFHDICIHVYENQEDETDRVYNAIIPFLRNEKHKNERTALLIPWNIDANEISDRLKRDGVQHFKISGIDSFQSVHMKTLIAHLNAVDNDFNLVAWSRILKQTYAVETYHKARKIIKEMRNIGLCAPDLLRDTDTYLSWFAAIFDSRDIVLFDTETTGVDVFNDDIIQIAAFKIRNGVKVEGSDFEIFLETNKDIPEFLGSGRNKILNPMLKTHKEAKKYSNEKGLEIFMNYIGDSLLMGHNINFDYNILKNNLKRYCGFRYDSFKSETIDTLKLAHLIAPRLRRYKLEYLIDKFELQGTNSHDATDDINATFELAKYCRSKTDELLNKQQDFLDRKEVLKIIGVLNQKYREIYDKSKSRLYLSLDNKQEKALVTEMKEVSFELKDICEFKIVDTFESICNFISTDVISEDEPNALKAHFQNHLMDMSTFREADMCESSSFNEKLFISTVHKAKGLEFENVVVMRAVDGRFPHFAHETYEQQEEDKRLFYVAISRAMKRLIISGSMHPNPFTPFVRTIIDRFTLRFVRDFENSSFLIEIAKNEMRVFQNGILIRKYTNISGTFNQFDLMSRIKTGLHSSDFIEEVDNIIMQLADAEIIKY